MAYNPYNPDEYLESPTSGVTAGVPTTRNPVGRSSISGGGVTGPQTLTDSSTEVPTNGTDGGGNEGGGGDNTGVPNTPCAPGYKKAFKPDGTFECVPESASGCPDGQEKSPFDASGNDAPYPLECVSTAEAQRRFEARKAKNASGSGGGGGGGGYTPPPAPKVQKSQYDDELAAMMMTYFRDIMAGKGLPFSDAVVNKLRAAALQTSTGRASAQQQALSDDLARAGLSRSGVAIDKGAEIQRNAGAQFSQDSRAIAVTAVQENFKAKKDALQQAQDFLNSERANQLGQANLTLAYAQLNQQWKSLLASFEQQMKVIDKGNESDITKLILCIQQGGTNCY